MLDYTGQTLQPTFPFWTWTNTESGAAVVVEEASRHAGRKKRRKRYIVEIDGQDFEVSSISEAEDLLSKAKALVAEMVEKPALVKPGIKLPQIRTPNRELVATVRQARAEIRETYTNLQRLLEIRYLMAKAEEDEEEAIIRLLM